MRTPLALVPRTRRHADLPQPTGAGIGISGLGVGQQLLLQSAEIRLEPHPNDAPGEGMCFDEPEPHTAITDVLHCSMPRCSMQGGG